MRGRPHLPTQGYIEYPPPPGSYLLLKIFHVQAKRWVVCRCVKIIKLRVHSLDIKELISIVFERKQLNFIGVISVSLSKALSSDCWVFRFIFRGKIDL